MNYSETVNAPNASCTPAVPIQIDNLPDYNNIDYLKSLKSDIDTLNKRLKLYMGCSVVNLSSHNLTPESLELLSYGLTFCPTPTAADNAAITEAVESFFRKLKLKVHFHQLQNASNASFSSVSNLTTDDTLGPADFVTNDVIQRLKITSTWTPDVQDNNLALFMTTVRKTIQHKSAAKKKPIRHNITDRQRRILKSLQDNKDITIKKADKGNSIVILDTVDYMHEALTQLSNRAFYAPQSEDLTQRHENLVNQLVTSWLTARIIDSKVHKFLCAYKSRTARFYLLPKIHKKGIPGRPIVSANGCPTEHLSAFVDALLCPLVVTNPSFIRDTTDFINKISNIPVNEGSIIFTCDVTSLYTRINHPLGLKCIAKKLRATPDFDFPKHRLIQALKLVLTCNNFEFNAKHYLQTSGVSMGTKCAPTYANLVLGVIEQEFLDSQPLKPTCWFRFIDDIFGVWDHSLTDLQLFVSNFNAIDEDIQITLDHSVSEVAFLDTVVQKSNNRLITDLYRKPTDTTNYLMHNSAHPPGCKKGAYSQFLRLRRNCTTITNYDTHSDRLLEAYVSRGYDRTELTKAQKKVRALNRADLLQDRVQSTADSKLVCTLPYNLLNIDARKIITDNWHILSDAAHLDGLFPEPPIFGYSRPKNLKDSICQATVRYPPDSSNIVRADNIVSPDTCTRQQCKWCPKINTRKRVKSSASKEKHKKLHIPTNVNCETCNVVYLITCTCCLKQYVGETKRCFRTRMSEHDRDVRYNKDTNVARHFNQPAHDWTQSKFDIIEHFPGDPDSSQNLRLKRETYWIATLRSLAPTGLNGMIGRQFTQ